MGNELRVLALARFFIRLPRLISLIHPDNVASKRVAEKNGMIPEKETIFRGFPAIVFAISRPSFDEPGDPKVVALGSSLSKQRKKHTEPSPGALPNKKNEGSRARLRL